MNSAALYVGTLSHHRYGPGPSHSFSYRVAMPYLDLDTVDRAMTAHPLWSASRPAPVWFRRPDYFGDPSRALADEIKGLVAQRCGTRPSGPVMALTHLRTWGWLFNPISLYFCLSADGTGVENLVADVENTPWHEHHQYVFGPPGEHTAPKSLHVSPFLPMGLTYRVDYGEPAEALDVRFRVEEEGRCVFVAKLALRRRPLERQEMGKFITHYPAMAHKVSMGIYAQAAHLALKGAPFYAHPRHRAGGVGRPGGKP